MIRNRWYATGDERPVVRNRWWATGSFFVLPTNTWCDVIFVCFLMTGGSPEADEGLRGFDVVDGEDYPNSRGEPLSQIQWLVGRFVFLSVVVMIGLLGCSLIGWFFCVSWLVGWLVCSFSVGWCVCCSLVGWSVSWMMVGRAVKATAVTIYTETAKYNRSTGSRYQA